MSNQNSVQAALDLAKELQVQNTGSLRDSLAELVKLLTDVAEEPTQATSDESSGEEVATADVSQDESLEVTVQEIQNMYSQFISFMVHELRKPMTSIRGYADMLDKRVVGELNDMQGQFVSTIRRNIISMEKLIADISDYTKMRNGRIKADPKMDLAKNVLLDVQKQTAELAEERSHNLQFEIPDGLPLLNLDSNRLKQALIKLLENAIKYTPEGGHITVTARPVEGGMEIVVKDNGVGLHPQELDRLGELWFRGDDELVTNSKGYGLGIPIVQECMVLCDGRLFYESEKGVGSTFGVFVPGMS